MSTKFYEQQKTKYFFGFCLAFLLPMQAWADTRVLDRVDNIPPRAWIGMPVASGPFVEGTVNVSSEEVIYRTFFNEQLQIGDIFYEDIRSDTSSPSYDRLPEWRSPAARLLARPYTDRQIYTRHSGTGKGVPFIYDALSAGQQNAVGGGIRDGGKVVDYTRGDRGNEVPKGIFRSRVGLLGEIVSSNLFLWHHTSAPNTSASNPLSVLYVGANDGMLHAFDAKTGKELFAYVPGAVIGNLVENAQLRLSGSADTLLPKPAYVDGQIEITRLQDPTVSSKFETVLVGTLGAGGEGLYALNVSNPKGDGLATEVAKAEQKVKWEITSGTPNFANMGRIYGAPRIATVNYNGKKTKAVIVGNGYYHGTGKVSLFVINLADGTLIKEFVADDATFFEESFSVRKPYGLSTPTPHDRNGDGVVDYAYAGAPDGKLWKFDLTDMKSQDPAKRPLMLYRAKLREGEVFDSVRGAPITTPPIVHFNEQKQKYMIIFGTGMITRPAHHTKFLDNTVYGIVDDNRTIDDNELDRTILKDGPRTFENYRVVIDGRRVLGRSNPNNGGWYMNLMRGDRIVGFLPVSIAGKLYVTTNTPTATNLLDPSWLHVLDMSTGLAPEGCAVFDRDNDGQHCITVRGEQQPDPGDLLPLQELEGVLQATFGLQGDLELTPLARERTLMAEKKANGAVSQPRLLSKGDKLVIPVFNWNTTGLQNTFDPTRTTLRDLFEQSIRETRFNTEVMADGTTVVRLQLEVKKLECAERRLGVCVERETEWLTAEEIIIKKDGSWNFKEKKRGIRSGFDDPVCVANCDNGYLDGKRISGILGNGLTQSVTDPGLNKAAPELKRKSWRVLEE